MLSAREADRISRLQLPDAGHGYDTFGMDRDWMSLAGAAFGPLHRHYFRVSSSGSEHIPGEGPAILVANHGGTLPIDAAMVCMDVLSHTEPPRVPRCVVDRFVPGLPFAGVVLSRCGAVSGTVGNVRRLLEMGELCLVFPEGLPAIGKPIRERYQLRAFRPGFAELAIRQRVPVVPIGVVGPEEQWPQIARIPFFHPFGLPYLPIVATPLPLPVHYRIRYGPALDLAAQVTGGEPTSEAFTAASRTARDAVEHLIARGLSERHGLFR